MQHGKVLRLRKPQASQEDSDGALSQLEQAIWQSPEAMQSPDPMVQQQAFAATILGPILGKELAVSGELVSLPGDFATALLRQCCRLTKGAVPAAASAEATTRHQPIRGLLMPDATLPASPGMPLPGMQWAGLALCAELKPKCGWLPRLEVLPPGHEVKARVPKFQLQQAVKLAKGSVTSRSAYNPLDLFSLDPARMQKALHALLAGPQNNLALFVSGVPAATWLQQHHAARDAQPVDGPAVLQQCLSLAWGHLEHKSKPLQKLLVEQGCCRACWKHSS
eukprot:jgi/Astpho2/9089/Aster-x0842